MHTLVLITVHVLTLAVTSNFIIKAMKQRKLGKKNVTEITRFHAAWNISKCGEAKI